MKKQLLIIAMNGTYNAATAEAVVQLLTGRGLEVLHASTRHNNESYFAAGWPVTQQEALAEFGIEAAVVPAGEPLTGGSGDIAAGVTLETVNSNVLQVLTLISMVSTQGKQLGTRSGAKEPKAGKKEGAADVKVLPEPPKNAGLDAEGKPAGPGTAPEGALPLPSGDPQPPKSPPPDVVEDSTGDDGDDSTTSATAEKKEGAEG